jgi:nucleoside-diphosphate-sugar epimerase
LFAFSDFIQQALSGHIDIHARHLVFRRFVDLEDFIKVATLASPRGPRVIDSGGRLIELGELAVLIFAELGLTPSIGRTLTPGSADDLYFSDESTWLEAVKETGLVPLTLEEQIVRVAKSLKSKI